MATTQYSEVVQAFHQWNASPDTQKPGVNGSSHTSKCFFVPSLKVTEYFKADGRLEELLEALLGRATSNTINPDTIRNFYPRTFAILLLIGEGHLIEHFVQYSGLADSHLPHEKLPAHFPFDPRPDLFQRFFNQQWRFCALELRYNSNDHLSKERILPISGREELDRGGNAVIFKVEVDQEYNRLVPEGWSIPERPFNLRNTFVQKTYRGPDARQQYHAERNAYLKITQKNAPPPFIIAYYGSFIDEDTFNIILEYADRRNLEDFMKNTGQPSTVEDMIELWDRLGCITHGLACIHGITDGEHGWHQDLKPKNILVFSGSGASQLDVYFKLADMSLCHFKEAGVSEEDPYALDAGGTRAYGAPETWRLDDKNGPLPLQVRQRIDLWSLGCVFSEAAVWSCSGWHNVERYRCQRKQEVQARMRHKGECIFHDGTKSLKVVHEKHNEIIDSAQDHRVAQSRRDIHGVPAEYLKMVNEKILLQENDRHHCARDIFHETRTIRDAQRERYHVPAPGFFSRGLHIPKTEAVDEEPPKTPPFLPPGYVHVSSRGDEGLKGLQTHSLVSGSRTSAAAQPSEFASQTSGLQKVHNAADRSDLSDRDFASSFGPFHAENFTFGNLPDPPKPSHSTLAMETYQDERTGILYQSSAGLENLRSLNDKLPSGTSNDVEDTARNNTSPRRTQSSRRPPNFEERVSGVSFASSTSVQPSRGRSRDVPTPPRGLSSGHHYRHPSSEINSQFQSLDGQQQSRTIVERPWLSLTEGVHWKRQKKHAEGFHWNRQKKQEGHAETLPGEGNLTTLGQRDHIFIIDNSESMKPYRDDVAKLVSLLTYMVKSSDSDGLDLYFTQSTGKINSKKSTNLHSRVRQEGFSGISDMRGRLIQIIGEHRNKLGKTSAPSRKWFKRAEPQGMSGRLSFYVLTDGNWQPEQDVGSVIQDLARELREKKLMKEHLGIQFIRFGNNAAGSEHLKHLDSGLGLKDEDMDFVDTTSWNGNVWKMLLGAINTWYDDDSN